MAVKRKAHMKQVSESASGSGGKRKKNGDFDESNVWFGSILNLLSGLTIMMCISYQFSTYLYQAHENNMWFSKIKVR